MNLSDNRLGPAGVKALVDGGAFTGSMTSIDLSVNNIGGYYENFETIHTPEGPKAIAEAIAVASSLTEVRDFLPQTKSTCTCSHSKHVAGELVQQ